MLSDSLRQALRFVLLYIVRPVFLMVGALLSSFYNVLFAWWLGGGRQKPSKDGFPQGFRVQRVGIVAAKAISNLPPSEVATHFREHPATARALLNESYDKRFSPSTFIVGESKELFRVGWYSTDTGYECVREFSNLADATTDYLLFSLGKGRWTPPQ